MSAQEQNPRFVHTKEDFSFTFTDGEAEYEVHIKETGVGQAFRISNGGKRARHIKTGRLRRY